MFNLFKKRLNYQRLSEKFFSLLSSLFYILPALTVIILVRLLRPWVLVRFGCLYSGRIGCFASNTEIYLCERDTGIQPTKRRYDIFYNSKPVANVYLEKMWSRVLHVCPLSRLVSMIIFLNHYLPDYMDYLIPLDQSTYNEDIYKHTPSHLYFTSKEEVKGVNKLRLMGIRDGLPFVCFHVRDSFYLNKLYPFYDWGYHSFRDATIKNYLLAAEELTKRGYFVLRMGAVVGEALATDNPMIIDYASKYRSDFLDLFLSAKCNFFLGSVSGIDEVPRIFRRPVIYVNCAPLEFIFVWNPSRLFIPKKIWAEKKGRLLSFQEIIDSGIGVFDHNQQYEEAGLKVVENTAEEIAAVSLEMDELNKNRWQVSRDDELLQQRFWQIMGKSKMSRKVAARVGRDFLRQNKELLN